MKFVLMAACAALLCCASAHGENCPFLNAATAGGVLGGQAAMTVTHPSGTETTCVFRTRKDGGEATLEITVTQMKDAADYSAREAGCGTDARLLVGVGNRAVACTLTPARTIKEQVIGHVRNRAFEIRWTMSADSAPSAPARTATVQNLSEAIAGSLF